MKILISLLIPVCLLTGCYGISAKKGDLISRTEDELSGLKKTVTAGEYLFSCQYKPAEYIIAKENPTDAASRQQRLTQFDSTVWFNVSISMNGAAVNPLKYNITYQGEYDERLGYFTMEARSHFTLVYNGITLTPLAYHFENNYGLTPMDVMIVGFRIPAQHPEKDMVLSYSDGLYNSGILKFGIKAENIQSIQ